MLITALQFTALIFRIAASFSGFYLAIIFFSKIRRAIGSGVDLSSFFGMAIFFLLGGFMFIFYTYWLFYLHAYNLEIDTLYTLGSLFGFCGFIGLVFFSEKMFGKTKYAFTIFSIISFIYGIFFIKRSQDFGIFATITLPIIFNIVVINFLYSLIVRTKGEIRKKMEKLEL